MCSFVICSPLLEYPSQEFIECAVAFDHSSDRRQRLMDHITEVGKSLHDTLDKYGIDVIIAPADCGLTKYSAATGTVNLVSD